MCSAPAGYNYSQFSRPGESGQPVGRVQLIATGVTAMRLLRKKVQNMPCRTEEAVADKAGERGGTIGVLQQRHFDVGMGCIATIKLVQP